MADSSSSDRESDRIADEAAGWVLRCDRGLTPEEQDAYSEWLAADPRHGGQIARFRRHWNRLDALAQWGPEHSSQPNPDLLAPPLRRRILRFWPVAATLAAAAVVAVVVWQAAPEANRNVAVAAPTVAPAESAKATVPIMRPIPRSEGERMLTDGSVVQLNPEAEIDVQYGPAERRIILSRGEAHFSVAKDPARPFIVLVGGVEVRAVGTAFNIRVAPSEVEVLVTHGRVELDPVAPAAAEAPTVASSHLVPVPLAARQRAVIPRSAPTAPQIATLTPEEITRVMAWQHRLLDFTAVPLREVVAEFNRSNVVQLVVDPKLADLRVSASIRSDNVEGFVALLEAGFGVRVERRGDADIFLRDGS